MSDLERATFFLHWLAWALETGGVDNMTQAALQVREHSRFKALPELYRGQIEGFVIGAVAVKEGLVR